MLKHPTNSFKNHASEHQDDNHKSLILFSHSLETRMDNKRPSLDQYFMKMAKLASERSTCLRRSTGAVVVKEKHILSTGYNGPPKGMRHCKDVGCLREKLKVPSGERHELCRGLHAEENAIIQAAFFGVPIKDATIYCTLHPCSVCAKMIINAGIKEIVYEKGYPDKLSKEILKESGIKVRQFMAND